MELALNKAGVLPEKQQARVNIQDKIEDTVAEIGKVVLGKEKQVRLALCCAKRRVNQKHRLTLCT